ncbi:hypothetical protein GGR51DRAFT_556842 [Nemania sp. FL0031]|nr:hypothetical protein GGR51DRAFT_556842 [Nemania sp. FL0031]
MPSPTPGVDPTNATATATQQANGAQATTITGQHRNEEVPATIASRRRFYIMGGVALVIIVITALAMRAAGCVYDDIKWPITVEIMMFSIFLTPAFANAINP